MLLNVEEIEEESLNKLDSYEITENSLTLQPSELLINNTDARRFNFDKIWDNDSIYNYINYTASQVSWMEVMEIGRTYHNNSLQVVKIDRYPNSHHQDRQVHVIMAAWDSKFWVSIKSVLFMLNRVLRYDENTYDPIHPLVTRNLIYLVPFPNPDGYTHTLENNRFWSKNFHPIDSFPSHCIGVNLAMNARSTVSSALANKTCDLYFDGTGPFSEVETEAMYNFTVELIANTTLQINYFQLEDQRNGILYQPFSFEVTSEVIPDYEDVFTYFKDYVYEWSDGTYSIENGIHSLYPTPESHFFDILIAMGVTKTFIVGLPLSFEEFISPTGMTERLNLITEEVLAAVTIITDTESTAEAAAPYIQVAGMVLPWLILILSFMVIVVMHEDTVLIQEKRAAAAKLAPQFAQAVGATRKFKTKVLKGGEVKVKHRKSDNDEN